MQVKKIRIFHEPGTLVNKKLYISYINTVSNHCVILPKISYKPKATDNNRFSKKDIEILVKILNESEITSNQSQFIIPGMCDEIYIDNIFFKKNQTYINNKKDSSNTKEFLAYKKRYYTHLVDGYYIRNQTYRDFQNIFYTHTDNYSNTFNVIFNDFESADTQKILSQIKVATESKFEEKKIIPIVDKIKSISSPMPIYRTDHYDEHIDNNLNKSFNDLKFDKFICHQSRDKTPYLITYLNKNNKQTIWYDLAQLTDSDSKLQAQAKMLAGIFLADEICIFLTNAFLDKFLFNIYSVIENKEVGDGICFELSMCKLLRKKYFNIISFNNCTNEDIKQILNLIHIEDKIHLDYKTTVNDVRLMLKEASFETCI